MPRNPQKLSALDARAPDRAVGVVLESESYDVAIAAIVRTYEARPGTFLKVLLPDTHTLLAVVRGTRYAGGVITNASAGFLLSNLDDLEAQVQATYQLVELRYVGVIAARRVEGRRPRAFPAGARVLTVSSRELTEFLELAEDGEVKLGEHSRHADLKISLSLSEIQQGHVAVLGQTGSGKTNVLRLLHDGFRGDRRRTTSYVLFDFHNEFNVDSSCEQSLEPPFSFGANDLRFELLTELLPNLSAPQQDLLAQALDTTPSSIPELSVSIRSSAGSEASKRVLMRRLQRLESSSAFGQDDDVSSRVARLAAKPGTGTILRLGAVQTELAQVFISTIVRRLMAERMRGHIAPVVFIVDEAHRLMSLQSSPSGTRTFRFVAQEGRKFGMTMVLATQRPSLIDSTILSQCSTLVALRMRSPEDARSIASIMTETKPTDLSSLGVGQGLLFRLSGLETLWIDFMLAKSQPSQRPPRGGAVKPLQQELFDE